MKDIELYRQFLERKKQTIQDSGFRVEEKDLNPILFPFQKYCVAKALKKGRYALFEDCGLGKTIQQLEWSRHIANHTNKPVLIIAPLAVVGQTIAEGEKFGYEVIELEERPIRGGFTLPTMTISRMSLQRIMPEWCLMRARY